MLSKVQALHPITPMLLFIFIFFGYNEDLNSYTSTHTPISLISLPTTGILLSCLASFPMRFLLVVPFDQVNLILGRA